MAWGLQFDGVNDYAWFSGGSAKDFIATGDFTITGTFTYAEDATNRRLFESASGSQNLIIMKDTGLLWARVGTSTQIELSGFVDGETIDFTLSRASGIVTFEANGTSDTQANTNTFTLRRLSSLGTPYKGVISALTMDASATSGHNYFFDFDGSDHGNTGQQPLLIESNEGSDATGVGFPTDGSAWIDLGGSGSSGTVAVTMNPLTVSASGNIGEAVSGAVNSLFNGFTVDASGSIGDTTTGAVNVTLAGATISASGNVGEPVNGTASASLDSLSINGNGNIGEAVTGTASQQLIDFTVDAEGTFALAVTGAVNIQMDDFTIFGRESQGGGIYGVISVIPIEAIEINAEPIEVITK